MSEATAAVGAGAPAYTVLGASGFIGSRLASMLAAEGLSFYAPGRGAHDLFQRDLGKVFYCVGLTADYLARPHETVEAHVTLLGRLLQSGNFERLVYLSSTRLYDSLGEGRGYESRDLTLNPTVPRHLYDLSKALGESLCLSAGGGRASVARLSCVYDAAPGAPGFMSQLLQTMRGGRRFELASATGVVRDYVLLDDTVRSLKAILDRGSSGIFNVASGENLSNREIVEWLNARGFSINLARQTEREPMAECDVSKLAALGVTPRHLRDYLEGFLAELDDNAAR